MVDKKPTIAICYGFAEGTWHSRKILRHLKEHGFGVTKNAQDADVVIAHSGACYVAPVIRPNQMVLFVGYTHWPGRPLLSSLKTTLRYDRKRLGFWKWLQHCIVCDVYMLNLAHTLRMIPGWRNPQNHLQQLPRGKYVFIRNQEDPYCHFDSVLADTDMEFRYVSLPGGHNALWQDPKPFIDLLQSIHKER